MTGLRMRQQAVARIQCVRTPELHSVLAADTPGARPCELALGSCLVTVRPSTCEARASATRHISGCSIRRPVDQPRPNRRQRSRA